MIDVSIYYKPCFGKCSCWNNVKRKCKMAVECELKHQAEMKKAEADKKKESKRYDS